MNKLLLAFDFGMKKIGVAVGQTVTKTARPLSNLKAQKGEPDWSEVDKLIHSWKPDEIIVGIPLNMDGTKQPITDSANQFAESLRKRYEIKVCGMDERLTTKSAREEIFSRGGYKALQKGQIDSVAAKLILEAWFTQQNER